MKRVITSLICVYLCLLAAFSCGLGELLFCGKEERPSYTENRMLQAFPAFNGQTLRSGSFMDGFEAWLSDAFFFRDEAASFSDAVKGIFRLSSDEDPVLPAGQAWEMNEEQRQELDEQLAVTEAGEPQSVSAESAPAAAEPLPAPRAPEDGRTPAAEDCRRPTPAVTQDASIWKETADGREITIESFSAANIATIARTLNEYRAALPADGTVSLLNPMVADVANTVLQEHSAVNWACDLDEVMQPWLDEGVRFFDETDILRPYIGQYTLYPTIDHHWHPISSKLVQTEMLRTQGVVSNSYDEYLYWLDNVSDAGPFTTEELGQVTRSIEQVPVLVLNAPAESYRLEHLDERSPSLLIDHEGSSAYAQYFGGNLHTWREFVTGFHTGRNALVIGDSFDLPFVAYLFPYYDEILVTDFRDGGYSLAEAGANVHDYIAAHEISDVYIIYCSYFSLNTETVQDRLERYFFKEY